MVYTEEEYEKRIAALFERHQSVQSVGFNSDAYKPGLGGMQALDEVLGHPWTHYRCVHVAGTNGKGSVASMLAAALSSDGLKVGLYTSPHLIDFRERMKLISGGSSTMPTKEWVWDFLEEHEADLEGRSFFEITTGMAFKWFESMGVDMAVIEVGLGGRLDSTNIITPSLSIVTSIGLDHCAILGDTRAKIAYEKAGIFKPGVPAVVGYKDDETAEVFEKIATEVGCPLKFADCDKPMSYAAKHNVLRLDLKGPCQQENLRTVFVALKMLKPGCDPEDYVRAISRTGSITAFQGRWEKLSTKPEVICDIGHNPPALKANFERLAELGRPLIIVYGVMADKDLDGIAPLMPKAARYILCAPATSRAMDAGTLRSRLALLRPELDTVAAPSVAAAVQQALAEASGMDNPLIYIGGSTFVVSEAVK